MINLQVDEGYAFDYLSILEVKKNLFPSDSKRKAYDNCLIFLKNQLPPDLFKSAILSVEYHELYKINEKTFHLVDKARNGGDVTAKQVDDANMERFYRKQDLQKKFFKNESVEQKIV